MAIAIGVAWGNAPSLREIASERFPMSQEGQTVRAHCPRCDGERNCLIRAEATNEEGNDIFEWTVKARIVSCAGCDYSFCMSVSDERTNYEYLDKEAGEYRNHPPDVAFLPPTIWRKTPVWLSVLTYTGEDKNLHLFGIMTEVYEALNARLDTLAAIGIRTSFEVVAEILGAPDINFQKKIRWLVDNKAGLLTSEEEAFRTLVEAGNAAAHRGWRPKPEVIDALMNLLEGLVRRDIVDDIIRVVEDAQNEHEASSRADRVVQHSPSIPRRVFRSNIVRLPPKAAPPAGGDTPPDPDITGSPEG
ncbi:DUF4145 domain-containing protein [Gluconacetobacter sp.]|uniref:DUF4145 domain-containing protein n=1 Tax=Gluconacetobacter sp. TaxID=1935994 RepID=UPI0039EC4155